MFPKFTSHIRSLFETHSLISSLLWAIKGSSRMGEAILTVRFYDFLYNRSLREDYVESFKAEILS